MSGRVRLPDSVTAAPRPFQIEFSAKLGKSLRGGWYETSVRINPAETWSFYHAGTTPHQPGQAQLLIFAGSLPEHALDFLPTTITVSNQLVEWTLIRRGSAVPERRDRLSWLSELGDRIDSFAGKWIAIGDNGLLAVEDSARAALDKAREAGEERPLLHHIPTRDQAGGFGL